MPEIHESELIKDVQITTLRAFGDDRGRFTEFFRKEWFPQRSWESVQTNRSESVGNVLRGLHFHRKQVDYWHVIQGTIRAALADLRPDSPTFKQTQTIELHGNEPMGLFIPVGVAHGFVSLTDCVLLYVVDNYYDSTDEYGVIWNDPTLNVAWDVEDPILSGRDQQNPLFTDIDPELLASLGK